MNHEQLRDKALSKKSVARAYKELEPEYALARRMLAARRKAAMTQADVARRMGTKTPAVARLERSLISGTHSPSLSTLKKYASAVSCRLAPFR